MSAIVRFSRWKNDFAYSAVRATVEVQADDAVLVVVREDRLRDLPIVGGHAKTKSWVVLVVRDWSGG